MVNPLFYDLPLWGDKVVEDTEVWDDGRADDADGCSSTCQIESGYDIEWLCRYSWTYQGAAVGSVWHLIVWGDSLRDTGETCDDGNTSNGDGWSSTCTLEIGWNWAGGSSSTPDTCSEVWGDGKVVGTEVWDDGDSSDGNGCSSTWTVETGWNCWGGSPTSPDTCIEIWGDGKRFNTLSTYWDDGNTNDNDGWSSTCSTEVEFSWNGGSQTNPDTCFTNWGDSKKIGSEGWDDGNIILGDGCNEICSVEIGWTWTGGTPTTQDIWNEIWGDAKKFNSVSTYWDDGNTNSNDGWSSTCSVEAGWICSGGSSLIPDSCTEIWGDGKKFNSLSTYWDDGNANNNDGWSFSCSVELGYSWAGGTSSTADTWSPIWGDSMKIGSEDWDDGNTSDGDGWNSTCQVEDNWSCTGSLGGTSIWTENPPQLELTTEAVSTQAIASAGAAASIISGLTSLSNPVGLWQMINTMQLFMLILLLDIYLPIRILNVYNASSGFNLSFDVSFITKIPYVGEVYKHLYFLSPRENYSMLGISSGSTLINILSFTLLLIAIAIVHIWLIPWRIVWGSEDSSEDDGCFRNIYYRLWKFMSFNAYLRLIIQSYQHLFIVSVLGIYFGSFENAQQLASSVASIATLIFWIVFPLVSLIALCKDWKGGINELSVGLKSSSYSKLYQIVLILRKVVLISWMIWFKFIPKTPYLIFPSIYQFFHICYILICRPFISVKDNIIEIYNEITFTLMLSGLIYLKTESKWNGGFTKTYSYLMMMPGIFMMIVTLSKSLFYT
jgi:cysteine-rich repeat protein